MDPTTMLDPEIADVLRQLPAAVTATLTVERIPELRSMLDQRVAGLRARRRRRGVRRRRGC